MSAKSTVSDNGSFKSASDAAAAGAPSSSKDSKSSYANRTSGSFSDDRSASSNGLVPPAVSTSRPSTPSAGPSASGGTSNVDSSGYPFPQVNNANLPPSLQQWEPMEPILLHRDRDGNLTPAISTPTQPNSASDNHNAASNNSNNKSDHHDSSSPKTPTPNSVKDSSDSSVLSSGVSGNVNVSAANSSSSNLSTSVASNGPSSLNSAYFSAPNTPMNGPSTPRSIPLLPHQNSPGGVLNIDEVIQRLLDAGYSGKTTRSVCLKNSEIAVICQTAREIFLSQPTLLELTTPVKIVGDVHGQYGDLIRMFDMCGFPPSANYLFLGDYVDRGKQSLETILLLLCYKIKYPENFFLLRGNHECANVTRVYGFYDECKRRCNVKTWKIFVDTFNCLPIAAVVAHKIFCVHGGLSPSLNSMNEIRHIERPTDVPDYGLLNDLLWSDPADTNNEWEDNERGVSYCFNKVAINKFLANFGFDLVCRAHMVVEDGYEFFNDKSLVTVFSAPNYCGEFDNWGAVMSVSEDLLCTFELLRPLDSVALKQVMRKGKNERRSSLLMNQTSSGSGNTGPQSF